MHDLLVSSLIIVIPIGVFILAFLIVKLLRMIDKDWSTNWYWLSPLTDEFTRKHPFTTILLALGFFIAFLIIRTSNSPTFHLYCKNTQVFDNSCGGAYLTIEFFAIYIVLFLIGLILDFLINKFTNSNKDNIYVVAKPFYGTNNVNIKRVITMTIIGIVVLILFGLLLEK